MHLNYTPSYQHFKAFAVSKFDSETTFQRELKVHSLQAIQHVSSGIHVYIYTISNQHFKAFTVSTVTTSTGLCATCTRQETRMSFCVLTCTRASFLAGGGSHDQFISMHGMFECEQYWNQIYTCISLRSVMHSKYRIMPPPYPPPTPYMLYLPSQHLVSNIQTCIAQNR